MDVEFVSGIAERSVDQLADELVDCAGADLDDRLRSLELLHRKVEAELALTIARSDATGLYDVDGHRSMKGYLRATCNWSNGEVAVRRRLARAGDHVPGLAEALHTGYIGVAQANVIAKLYANPRIRDRVVECAATLLEVAEHYDFDDFTRAMQRFEMLADLDGAHRDLDERREARNARVTNLAGELHLDATGGDPLVNDELEQIFKRFVEHEFRIDAAARREEHGDEASGKPLARTHQQRCYDAFVDLMRRADAHLTDQPGHVAAPARTRTNLLIDEHTWALTLADSGLAPTNDVTGQPVDPFTGLPLDDVPDLLARLMADPATFVRMRCETSAGTLLHPHQVLRATLAGYIRRVVVNAQGVPINLGRSRRLFTGPARDAATLLATHCEHAGCDLPDDFCEVDHITEWGDHGATDQENAAVDCSYHNRVKNQRRFNTRRDRLGRAWTIRPDGTVILPVGARPPVFPPGETARRDAGDDGDPDSESPAHPDGAADPDAA